MYERPFYITDAVSNNAFNFEKRTRKKLFVPALKEGSWDDVLSGQEIVFEDFNDEGNLCSCTGLKHFVKISGKRPVYIFDNHNHAFAFWHLELIKRHLHPGALLIHIDQHADSRKPARFLSRKDALDEEKVFSYTNAVLNVGNFVPAAVKTSLVKKVININSADSVRNRHYRPEEMAGDIILDIDLDFFAPEMDYIAMEEKLKFINNIAGKASVVTIATSPFFIKHDLAAQILIEIRQIFE